MPVFSFVEESTRGLNGRSVTTRDGVAKFFSRKIIVTQSAHLHKIIKARSKERVLILWR